MGLAESEGLLPASPEHLPWSFSLDRPEQFWIRSSGFETASQLICLRLTPVFERFGRRDVCVCWDYVLNTQNYTGVVAGLCKVCC